MKTSERKKFFSPAILFSFIFALFVVGIILSLIINIIFGKFSFILLRIALINSLFLSIGMFLNMLIIRNLILKLKNYLIFFLSFLIILGISLIGFLYLFYEETFFFIYETNLIYAYFLINFLFIISISIITTGFMIFQISIFEKEKELSSEKVLREQIEQKLYSSKINPHFLFNSLSMIISLLKNPKKAEKALIYLSELLRYNLNASGKEVITLDEELKYVEKYLFIQKLRFEERLTYKITNSESAMIPPLIIQPLVENSIKHNINEANSLDIKIDVLKHNGKLYIKIFDSMKKLSDNMIGAGIGLANTKRRIEITGGEFIIKDGGIEIIFSI